MTLESAELQTIKSRLSDLETQNRRLKWAGLSLLAVFSAIVLMGQAAPTPKVIEAQRFVLKDASGEVRAWWGLFGEGSEFILGDANKQPKMTMKVSEEASDLHLFGGENSGMNLGVDLGKPAIAMAGAHGTGEAGIVFSASGPAITVKDAKGFSTIIGAGQPNSLTHGAANQASGSSILLLDQAGKVIWKAR